MGIANQHDQAVHADAEATGGGHAVFHGTQEVFVDGAGFIVACLFRLLLVFKAHSLFDWVVEFRIRIGKFATTDEQFETFGEEWVVAVDAGKWADFNWMASDECWLAQCGFARCFEELFDDLAGTEVRKHGG